MSTWFSWAKAAPGVMVEIVDAVEGKRAPWRVAVGPAWAWKDAPVGVTPHPPPAARPSHRRTDAQRRA